jgi:hypothetical protein
MYYISHGGPGSGRYPLGSGERPYQKYEGRFGTRRSHEIKKKASDSIRKGYLEKGSLAKRTAKSVGRASAVSGIITLMASASPASAALAIGVSAVATALNNVIHNRVDTDKAKANIQKLSDTYNLNDLNIDEETKKKATKVFDEYLNIAEDLTVDSNKVSDDEWGDRMKELEKLFDYFKEQGDSDQDAISKTTASIEAGVENYKKGGYFN